MHHIINFSHLCKKKTDEGGLALLMEQATQTGGLSKSRFEILVSACADCHLRGSRIYDPMAVLLEGLSRGPLFWGYVSGFCLHKMGMLPISTSILEALFHKRQRCAFLVSPACSPDAMHIIVIGRGKVKIDNMRHVGNV